MCSIRRGREARGRLRRPPVCEDCRVEVALIAPPLCARCGEPFDPLGQGAPVCATCRKKTPRFSLARSAAYYERPLVRAIWEFKYGCQMALGEPSAGSWARLGPGRGRSGGEECDAVCARFRSTAPACENAASTSPNCSPNTSPPRSEAPAVAPRANAAHPGRRWTCRKSRAANVRGASRCEQT